MSVSWRTRTLPFLACFVRRGAQGAKTLIGFGLEAPEGEISDYSSRMERAGDENMISINLGWLRQAAQVTDSRMARG
jgi:hypothetical protein